MTNTNLADRLRDEADLCRNDGANDIANLLDEAAKALDHATAQPVAMTDERAAFQAWARDEWGDKPIPDNAWKGWQARAILSAQAAPKVPDWKTNAVTLSAVQLREALEFAAPDFDNDEEQRETEVCISWAPDGTVRHDEGGFDAAGYVVWLSDYPEEGCMPLDGANPRPLVSIENERARKAALSPEAKAQAVPVAEVYFGKEGWRRLIDALVKLPGGTKLYTAPQPPVPSEQRKPLSEEQITKALLAAAWPFPLPVRDFSAVHFARAIEAAHGIRSTGGEHE